MNRGREDKAPPLADEVLAVDSCWEEERQFSQPHSRRLQIQEHMAGEDKLCLTSKRKQGYKLGRQGRGVDLDGVGER